jgi:hypothetical protein
VNYGAPYIEDVVKWLDRIRERTSAWLRLWGDGAFDSAPRLYLVRRDRGGRGARLAQRTARRAPRRRAPRGAARAARAAAHARGPGRRVRAELDADLAWLDERGLVWTEDDRTMSLVLLGEY